jgi:hypothetical protein
MPFASRYQPTSAAHANLATNALANRIPTTTKSENPVCGLKANYGWFILLIPILLFFILKFFCREFTYDDSSFGRLQLQMLKKNSSSESEGRKTAAEIILWYWNATKEIVILHVRQHNI